MSVSSTLLRFIVDNINEWQHSAMYLAFLISGVVDLVGFYAPQGTLPPGTEQVKYPALHCKSTFLFNRFGNAAHKTLAYYRTHRAAHKLKFKTGDDYGNAGHFSTHHN